MRLIQFTIAWTCGILLGVWLWQAKMLGCTTPAWPGLLAALLVAFGLWALRRHTHLIRYGILVWWLLLGLWRFQLQPLAACAGPGDLAFYNGAQGRSPWVSIEGWVTAYPDIRDRTVYYRFRADRLTIAGETRAIRGDVLVLAARWPVWRYGDRLVVSGTLESPPSLAGFDYPAYLAQQGIFSRLRAGQITQLAGREGSSILAFLYDLRSLGVNLVDRSLSEPAAALANGMLLGVQSSIPADVYDAFKATGTAHVIVISGSNIALFSGYLMAGLARLLGRRRAVIPAVAAVAVYVALAGGDASAVRAGIMAAIYLGAVLVGRQNLPLLALAAAVLVMTAANVRALFDVGFQLSVLATLGLILLAPAMQRRFSNFCQRHLPATWAPAWARFVGETVLISLAAQVMTLPLTAARFGRLSPISLVANFLILPVQPAILLGGLALLLAGALWSPLATLIAPVPWLFLTYTVQVVRVAASLPFASIAVGAPGYGPVALYYAAVCLMVGGAWLARKGYQVSRLRRPALWVLAVVLPVLVIRAAGGRADGRLHVYYVPGGGGEAAVIVTPTGRRVFVSNAGTDAMTGLERSRSLPTGWRGPSAVLLAGAVPQSWQAGQVIDPGSLASGQILQLDNGLTLTRLEAGETWAFALRYSEFSTILPATLSQAAQVQLLANHSIEPVTMLKTAEAGTGAWPSAEFLTAAEAQLTIWPQDAQYPPGVAAHLEAQGAIRTEAGALLEVISDGRSYWWRQWGAAAGT